MMLRLSRLVLAVLIAFGAAGAAGSPSPRHAFAQATGLTITSTTLPDGKVGTAYSASLAAQGGTAPYTWSITNGTPPPGIIISTAGAVNGTPTFPGTLTFTMRVQDSAGASASATLVMNVLSSTTVTISTTALPNAQVGAAYSYSLAAVGVTQPYVWSLSSGSLPAGLELSASGSITGTPAASGSSSFTVQVTDGAAAQVTQTLSIVVGATAPVIENTPVPSGGGISSGSIPAVGFGIIVFSGGTVTELVAAANCAQQTLAFWATIEGQFIGYVPNTTIGAVNAQFLNVFPGGVLPTNMPLVARC